MRDPSATTPQMALYVMYSNIDGAPSKYKSEQLTLCKVQTFSSLKVLVALCRLTSLSDCAKITYAFSYQMELQLYR